MTKILSQEEVEFLLKVIDEGEIGAQEEGAEENCNPPVYGFRKEHGPVHRRMSGTWVVPRRSWPWRVAAARPLSKKMESERSTPSS